MVLLVGRIQGHALGKMQTGFLSGKYHEDFEFDPEATGPMIVPGVTVTLVSSESAKCPEGKYQFHISIRPIA